MLLIGAVVTACGGSTGAGGGFGLIQFLESGQNNIPRNRQLRFRFNEPVADGQDLFTRLKIQNVEQIQGQSNFARAQGFYLISADEVIFTPRLPNKPDRSDAGFRSDGNYHVFLTGGPDGLRSSGGSTIPTQQEFIFETNQFFEDVIPAEPPRALQLVAIDPTNGDEFDISRFDPRPTVESATPNVILLANDKVIEPGAGGPDEYATPWHIELRISESVDPSTVNDSTVQLHEIYEDAFDSSASDYLGNPVNFRVSANVEVDQSVDIDGNYDIRIRVIPLQTLVDNTRYRISFSGQVLGIDFRKTFSGDNGLTGDGASMVGGTVYPEDGGRGYVSEFLVYDRDSIDASRTLHYDPFIDGIEPEYGQTLVDEDEWNSALYNPAQAPSTAIGFLSAFGQGLDGDFAVSSDAELNTGDTPNEPLGFPFTVNDLNPDNDYLNNTLPGGPIEYDSVLPFELQLSSMTVSSSATLTVIGVNPVVFRVTGIVQVTGVIDVSGESGEAAGNGNADGGAPGAGGFAGADSRRPTTTTCLGSCVSGTCRNFSVYLNACSQSKAQFPTSVNGEGPGRGLAGGEVFIYPYDTANTTGSSGGGGGSHATQGTAGEDRKNASVAQGQGGNCDNSYCYNTIRLSSVVGVRGQPGPAYGDNTVETNNMGGSGGGAGGAHYTYYYSQVAKSGGAGGGGGGSVTIISAGNIFIQSGVIDASGGDGGNGLLFDAYKACCNSSGWGRNIGGGGGGAGGTIALISGADIDLTASTIDASGGSGGARGESLVSGTGSGSNAGGDGGQGFIFLMDADGEITGFNPGKPNYYPNDSRGVLTISEFNADRFSSITAVTTLFPVTTAKPMYTQYDALKDILGNVANNKQRIRVSVSSALSDPAAPANPDASSEDNLTEIALLYYDGGATKVSVSGNMNELNDTPGKADRRAFVRVRAAFEYDNGVEAALGPYASMDEVKISYTFNG
jgi:hypothetical protein